jgi:hypothetical protein
VISAYGERPLAKSKIVLIVLLLIILLAASLRLYGIWWGLPTDQHYHRSFHPDETAKLDVIMGMSLAKLDLNPHWFIKGTMQFYVIGAVLKVASVFDIVKLKGHQFYVDHPSELAKLYVLGRLLTVLVSLLTIFLVFIIGSKLYNRGVGLFAALLLSVLPVDVVNSHYMKTDVPQTFWLLVTVICAIKIWRSKKRIWYVLAGLSAGFATATKYPAGLSVFLITIAHLLQIETKVSPGKILRSLFNKKLVLGYSFAVFGFIIGNPYALLSFGEFWQDVHNTAVGSTTLFSTIHLDYDFELDGYLRGPMWTYYLSHIMHYGMGLPLQIASITSILFALIKRSRAGVLLLSWVVPYFLLMGSANYAVVRYLTPLGPFLMILSASMFLSIPRLLTERVPIRYGRIVFPALLALLLVGIFLYSLFYSLAYDKVMASQDPRITALDWIKANIPKGSHIGVAFCIHWYTPPLDKEEYRIVPIDMDPDKLHLEPPEYFLITNYEYRQYLRLGEFFPYPRTAQALDILLDGKQYEQIRLFEQHPNLCGIPFPNQFPPHDWMYPYPTVMILKRCDR